MLAARLLPLHWLQWLLGGLSEEQAAALRDELDARLRAASDGSGPSAGDLSSEAHGREVWARCEALTGGLVGELAEQLRLILEPTLASRLAGDYRSGKRINMKKVGGGRAGWWVHRVGALVAPAGCVLCGAASMSQANGKSLPPLTTAHTMPPHPRCLPHHRLPLSARHVRCLPAGDWLHCQPLPKGQDLDAPHPARQAQVSGGPAGGWV